jgi:hypothetical protein
METIETLLDYMVGNGSMDEDKALWILRNKARARYWYRKLSDYDPS